MITTAEAKALLASKLDVLASHEELATTYRAIAASLPAEKAKAVFDCIDELQHADELLLLATTNEDFAAYLACIQRFDDLSAKAGLVLDDRVTKGRPH